MSGMPYREGVPRRTGVVVRSASKTTADKLREITAKAFKKLGIYSALTIEYDDIKADLACVAAKRGNCAIITRNVSKEVLYKLESVDCLRIERVEAGIKISWGIGK